LFLNLKGKADLKCMRDYKWLCLLISAFLLLPGCAIHAPMSEMVMFHDKGGYSARYSHAIGSFTGEMYGADKINEYARSTKPLGKNSEYHKEKEAEISFTTNAIFMFEDTDRFAFSLSLGMPPGADLTVKLPAKFYFTGTASYGASLSNSESNLNQFQVILQRRLKEGNPLGMSLGINWNRQVVVAPYDVENEGYSTIYSGLDNYTSFKTNSLGIRGVMMASNTDDYGSASTFLYLTGSYNYNFAMDIFYPKIGVSVGVY